MFVGEYAAFNVLCEGIDLLHCLLDRFRRREWIRSLAIMNSLQEVFGGGTSITMYYLISTALKLPPMLYVITLVPNGDIEILAEKLDPLLY